MFDMNVCVCVCGFLISLPAYWSVQLWLLNTERCLIYSFSHLLGFLSALSANYKVATWITDFFPLTRSFFFFCHFPFLTLIFCIFSVSGGTGGTRDMMTVRSMAVCFLKGLLKNLPQFIEKHKVVYLMVRMVVSYMYWLVPSVRIFIHTKFHISMIAKTWTTCFSSLNSGNGFILPWLLLCSYRFHLSHFCWSPCLSLELI